MYGMGNWHHVDSVDVGVLMDDWMREHLERIRHFEAMRRREIARNEADRRTFVGQLMRFGLCTCIAMGRYNTCCKGLENVKDGFFYVNR